MSTNEYLSYLDGISYMLDKLELIVVDELVTKFNETTDKMHAAKQEKNYDGLDGFYYYLGEQSAYNDMRKLIKRLTKDLKEQRNTGFR